MDLETVKGVLQVGPHRVRGDREILPDLIVRPTHGGEGEDLRLALGQGERSLPPDLPPPVPGRPAEPLELATDHIQNQEVPLVEVATRSIQPQAADRAAVVAGPERDRVVEPVPDAEATIELGCPVGLERHRVGQSPRPTESTGHGQQRILVVQPVQQSILGGRPGKVGTCHDSRMPGPAGRTGPKGDRIGCRNEPVDALERSRRQRLTWKGASSDLHDKVEDALVIGRREDAHRSERYDERPMARHCPAYESRAMTGWPIGNPPRHGRCLATVVLAIGLAACGGQSGPTAADQTGSVPSATPRSAATAIPAPGPTAWPRTPAPAELQGKWRTSINDADKPVLTITDFKYTIERLGIGTGAIEVHGDQIDFFGSNLCSGRGSYTWSIDNGTLTLTAAGPDPCPNRADAIRDRPFTRLE